jgi:hypothetical protein
MSKKKKPSNKENILLINAWIMPHLLAKLRLLKLVLLASPVV